MVSARKRATGRMQSDDLYGYGKTENLDCVGWQKWSTPLEHVQIDMKVAIFLLFLWEVLRGFFGTWSVRNRYCNLHFSGFRVIWKILKPSESVSKRLWSVQNSSSKFWRLLKSFNGFWTLQNLSGKFLSLQNLFSESWRLLKSFNGFWRFQKLSSGFWKLQNLYEKFSSLQNLSSEFWRLLKAFHESWCLQKFSSRCYSLLEHLF